MIRNMWQIVWACATSPLAWFTYLFMAVSLLVMLAMIVRHNNRAR